MPALLTKSFNIVDATSAANIYQGRGTSCRICLDRTPARSAWIVLLARAQAAKAAKDAINRYSIGGDALLHFAGAQAADAAEDAIDEYSIGGEQLLRGPDSPPLSSENPVGGARNCARQNRSSGKSPSCCLRPHHFTLLGSWYFLEAHVAGR